MMIMGRAVNSENCFGRVESLWMMVIGCKWVEGMSRIVVLIEGQ